MPKVSEEHRQSRKSEIAQAALRLLARKGFQSTSVADIIAESGLSAGAIYGHFKNKDELVQAAVSVLLDRMFSDVAAAGSVSPPPPPGQLIESILSKLMTEMGEPGLLVQVWAQATLDPTMRVATDRIGTHLREMFDDYLRHWYSFELELSDVDARANAAVFAPLYVGILQGFVIQSSIFTVFDRESYLTAASAIRPDLGLVGGGDGLSDGTARSEVDDMLPASE